MALNHQHPFTALLGAALLGTALCAEAVAADHCAILQYHHFSPSTPRSTSVTPEEFAAHLDYLHSNDFQVLPLRDVVSAWQHGQPLPDKCVSITVDDAYDSVYSTAYPMLQARGWSMTVFLNTDGIDEGVGSYLSWAQIRELATAGVAFENHSASHSHLQRRQAGESDAAWQQRIRADLQRAERRIREETGQRTTLLAYPYGEFDAAVQALVRELGYVAFGQQSGAAGRDMDRTVLPRFPMAAGYASMKTFGTKVRSLPMPLADVQPRSAITPRGEFQPQLQLWLRGQRPRRAELRCYVSGQSAAALSWDENDPNHVTVTPKKPLAPGRNRYNCTMPSAQAGRYHWYSHNWFVRHADGRWYKE